MAIGARGEADAEGKEKEEAVRAGSGGHVVIARPDCVASPIISAEMWSSNWDAPNRKSVNDRGIALPRSWSADGHFVLGEYTVSST
jgi:hypothetical protein